MPQLHLHRSLPPGPGSRGSACSRPRCKGQSGARGGAAGTSLETESLTHQLARRQVLLRPRASRLGHEALVVPRWKPDTAPEEASCPRRGTRALLLRTGRKLCQGGPCCSSLLSAGQGFAKAGSCLAPASPSQGECARVCKGGCVSLCSHLQPKCRSTALSSASSVQTRVGNQPRGALSVAVLGLKIRERRGSLEDPNYPSALTSTGL